MKVSVTINASENISLELDSIDPATTTFASLKGIIEEKIGGSAPIAAMYCGGSQIKDLTQLLSSITSSKNEEFHILCKLRKEKSAPLLTTVKDLVVDIRNNALKNKPLMENVVNSNVDKECPFREDLNAIIDKIQEATLQIKEDVIGTVSETPVESWKDGLTIQPEELTKRTEEIKPSTKSLDETIHAMCNDDYKMCNELPEFTQLLEFCQKIKDDLSAIKHCHVDKNLGELFKRLADSIRVLKSYPAIESNTYLDSVTEYENKVSDYYGEWNGQSKKLFNREEKERYDKLVQEGQQLVENVKHSISELESIKEKNNNFSRLTKQKDLIEIINEWDAQEAESLEFLQKDKKSLKDKQDHIKEQYKKLKAETDQEYTIHDNTKTDRELEQKFILQMITQLLHRYEECQVDINREELILNALAEKSKRIEAIEMEVDSEIVAHTTLLDDNINHCKNAQATYKCANGKVKDILSNLDLSIAEKEETYLSLLGASLQSKFMILNQRARIIEDDIRKKKKIISLISHKIDKFPSEIEELSQCGDYEGVEKLIAEKEDSQAKLDREKAHLEELESALTSVKEESELTEKSFSG